MDLQRINVRHLPKVNTAKRDDGVQNIFINKLMHNELFIRAMSLIKINHT